MATGALAGAVYINKVMARKSPAIEHQPQPALKAAFEATDPFVLVAIALITNPTGIIEFEDLVTVHPAADLNLHSAPAYLKVKFNSEIAIKSFDEMGRPTGTE